MSELASTLAAALTALGAQGKHAAASRPLTSVRWLDLERYTGKWYELARYPNWFQHGCHSDVTAVYTVEGETLQMVNSWLGTDGQAKTLKGIARVVDPVTHAKFKVNFFKPYSGNYWVVDLGREYEYAVIGEPERKYLWLLARQPVLDRRKYRMILENIRAAGYDPVSLRATEHSLRRAPQSASRPRACATSSSPR